MTPDKPALTRRLVPAIQFKHEKILQAPIDFLPFDEFAPTHEDVGVPLVKSGRFQAPTFFGADRMYKQQDLALSCVVKFDRVLFRVAIILRGHVLVGGVDIPSPLERIRVDDPVSSFDRRDR